MNPIEYIFPDAVIQIFCKARVAGQVKIRLMPQLTAEQAAAVHQQLSLRTFALVHFAYLCPVQLWCAPDVGHPFFRQVAQDYAFNLQAQVGGDLGERMNFALSAGLNEYAYAVLLGCDCPSLTVEDLGAAITALQQGYDVALAPTEDGGYCLVGLRMPHAGLFKGIGWSSPQVMAETRLKIASLGLKSLELKTQWDVDTYADYVRFLGHPS